MNKYPEYVRINGEKVKINTDTNTCLRALKIVDDNDISDFERALAIVYIMYGEIPDMELVQDYLEMAVKFLQCGKESKQDTDEKDMDIVQDIEYINASFMSDYSLDLSKENLHFWQFCNLITGLTDKCILNRIREIRTADINEYDKKERAKILKVKAQVALPEKISKEEQEKIDLINAIWGGY